MSVYDQEKIHKLRQLVKQIGQLPRGAALEVLDEFEKMEKQRDEAAIQVKRDLVEEILAGMTRQERKETITKVLELYGYD